MFSTWYVDRLGRVAGADEVAVQRVHEPLRVDGAAGGDQGLAGDLAAEDPLRADRRAHPPEGRLVDLLEVEHLQQLVDRGLADRESPSLTAGSRRRRVDERAELVHAQRVGGAGGAGRAARHDDHVVAGLGPAEAEQRAGRPGGTCRRCAATNGIRNVSTPQERASWLRTVGHRGERQQRQLAVQPGEPAHGVAGLR